VRRVEEARDAGDLPLWRQPEWPDELPWLVQATTGCGEGEDAFDLGLFGDQPAGRAMRNWRRLAAHLEMPAAVHAMQEHGAEIRHHPLPVPPGLLVMQGFDAHASAVPGLLMTVSIADCVPVFVVDERNRALALVHAGWRGVAGGILERALREMKGRFGSAGAEMRVHFGPAICGDCYEVGPEVHAAVLPDVPAPAGPVPIDLRSALADRAAAFGVPGDRTTVSAHCTRCGPGAFFSHRAGSAARQMGILGVRG
jgi:YfiH family protein